MSENIINKINLNGVNYSIQEEKLIKTTYSELKSLRDSSKLVPGCQYRITDYEFTTKQEDTKGAGKVFDIIVFATNENQLSELARAIQHEGDTYFDDNDLSAWELWYDLDNDAEKYAWADEENGKGVIYRMIDEKRNDCPYDFKNALFYNTILTINPSSDKYYYTFSYVVNGVLYDGTVEKQVTTCYDNSMGAFVDESKKKTLNSNVFKGNTFGDNCTGNTFGDNCTGNTFGGFCSCNKFGVYCFSNTFGNNCTGNTFGHSCNFSTFGDNCNLNTFGDLCESNTFEHYCQSNTFGSECGLNKFGEYCQNNTLGNTCTSNIFGNTCKNNTFGNNCQNNTFGNQCESNTIGDHCTGNTFGELCHNNSFETQCCSNTFGFGCGCNTFENECAFNAFGKSCYSNTFGNTCTMNSFGESCYCNTFGDYCQDNAFENYCTRNTFGAYCKNNAFERECNSNTFGNSCVENTFGKSCSSNTFGNNCNKNNFTGYCESNTFGDQCESNTFGDECRSNSFGNQCGHNTFEYECCLNRFGNICQYNTFGNICHGNTFGNVCYDNTLGDDVFNRKLNSDFISLNDEYYDDGSGKLVPIKHPDLSTQPSILPYKFMGQYVYEQLIPVKVGDRIVNCNFEVEHPMILSAGVFGINSFKNVDIIATKSDALLLNTESELGGYINVKYTDASPLLPSNGYGYGYENNNTDSSALIDFGLSLDGTLYIYNPNTEVLSLYKSGEITTDSIPQNLPKKNIILGKSVKCIVGGVFSGCSSLTSITIPEDSQLTSIGWAAFEYCEKLTTITIPESMMSIGDKAFEYCTGLTSITCKAITPPLVYTTTFNGVSKSIPVYVPTGSVEAYKAAKVWKDFTNIQAI